MKNAPTFKVIHDPGRTVRTHSESIDWKGLKRSADIVTGAYFLDLQVH